MMNTPPPGDEPRRKKSSTVPTAHSGSRTAPVRTDEELERHYLSRIGSRKQVPHLAMDPSQITNLSLDHRSGFLLSLIDGASTLEEILDVSGMPRLETLGLICKLLDHNVLSLTPVPGSSRVR
jgi:hypothetical protein